MSVAFSKRDLLAAGGCATCAVLLGGATDPPHFYGCFISPAEYQKTRTQAQTMGSVVNGLFARDRYMHTTGDQEMDRKLDRAMVVVGNLFGVKPAFGFYDPAKYRDARDADSRIMNAWATPENTDIPGTKGTVSFGIDLFRRELNEYDNTGSTIMAIVAHEFAHILQGYRNWLDGMRVGNPSKAEIHADFMSGYFLGTRKRQYPGLPFRKAGELFIRLGNNAPDRTHGNSMERLAAAEAGFGAAYREKKSFEEGIAESLHYVRYVHF
jgi:hypothetical protein